MCVSQVLSSLFVDIGSLPGQKDVWITSPKGLPGRRLQEYDAMPGSLKRTGAGDHTLTLILASPALYQLGRPPAPPLSCNLALHAFKTFQFQTQEASGHKRASWPLDLLIRRSAVVAESNPCEF